VPAQWTHYDTWRQVVRQPALVAWVLYLLLIPLYVFHSGLPQPGDAFVFILVPIVLARWNGKLSRDMRTVVRALIWFTLWVCCVDCAWAVITGSFVAFGPETFLLYPVYYIYNALIFLVALVMYRRYGELFLRVTLSAITATVFVQTVSSVVFRSAAARNSVFFNNPNQLGYYALLVATLIALTHRRLQLRLVTLSIVLVCCGWLAVTSASRAAVAGIAVLLVLLLFSNPKVIVVACFAAIIAVSWAGATAEELDASQERVLNYQRRTNHTFLEERGYDRIWRNEEYLLLGAGEGGLPRFDTAFVKSMELHSSPGTILFSYGLVGSILFLVFAWRMIRGARLRLVITLLPPLLYTGAHQGLRFTMLWIIFAVFIALKDDVDKLPRRSSIPGGLEASGRAAIDVG
jgi:hypothetical protein